MFRSKEALSRHVGSAHFAARNNAPGKTTNFSPNGPLQGAKTSNFAQRPGNKVELAKEIRHEVEVLVIDDDDDDVVVVETGASTKVTSKSTAEDVEVVPEMEVDPTTNPKIVAIDTDEAKIDDGESNEKVTRQSLGDDKSKGVIDVNDDCDVLANSLECSGAETCNVDGKTDAARRRQGEKENSEEGRLFTGNENAQQNVSCISDIELIEVDKYDDDSKLSKSELGGIYEKRAAGEDKASTGKNGEKGVQQVSQFDDVAKKETDNVAFVDVDVEDVCDLNSNNVNMKDERDAVNFSKSDPLKGEMAIEQDFYFVDVSKTVSDETDSNETKDDLEFSDDGIENGIENGRFNSFSGGSDASRNKTFESSSSGFETCSETGLVIESVQSFSAKTFDTLNTAVDDDDVILVEDSDDEPGSVRSISVPTAITESKQKFEGRQDKFMKMAKNRNKSNWCDICFKTLGTPSALSKHKRNLHQKSKSFHCDKCRKYFSTRQNLQQHQANAHEERLPYFCNICGEMFRAKLFLDNHVYKNHPRESAVIEID
jgi:RNase P subunit RPR2